MKCIKFLCVLLFFLVIEQAFSQENIGYIDLETVIKEHPYCKTIEKEIDCFKKEYIDSLEILQVMINNILPGWGQDVNPYLDTINIIIKQIEYLTKVQEKVTIQFKDSLNLILLTKIKTKAKQFAIKNNLGILINKKGILFGSLPLDYTEEFIKYLKSKN